MRTIAVLTTLLLFSCASMESRHHQAQAIVDSTAARHPNLVRLTIHAKARGESVSKILACNIPNKIGQFSDPEDLQVMETGQGVALKEGEYVDVTLPLRDAKGVVIAATGITLRGAASRTEKEIVKEAESIAQDISRQIQAANRPLW